MDIAKEFRRYLRVIWSWAWLILLGALIAGGINYYLSSKTPPRYEASTTLMVGQLIRQANPDQMEIGLADRLAVYYLELLRRQPVLEGVKQELQLDIPNEALAGMVAARVVPSTAFIEIAVVDTDPIRAVKLVNVFASHLIKQSPTAPESQRKEQSDFIQKQLDDLQTKIETGKTKLLELNQSLNTGTTAAEVAEIRGQIKALEAQIDGWQTNYANLLRLSNSNSPNSISVLEESNQSRRVKTLSPLISGAIAGAIGAVLALVFAFILEYLDDRLKSVDDIRARLKLPVIGHISRKGLPKKGEADSQIEANKDAAQEYEILCTNILFSEVFQNRRRSIMLTTPGEMKTQSQIALNLGISMVSFEQSVLLVDADTRKPELHELVGVDNNTGFFETFYGNGYVNMEDKVHETAIPNLYLMTAGNDSPDSRGIVVMRPGTHQIYGLPHNEIPGDFVLFKCGNILTDKTSRLLTPHVTAIVLVCELNQTRGQEMKAALEVLERLKGQVLGVVTIQAPRPYIFRLFDKKVRPKVYKKSVEKHLEKIDVTEPDVSVV
jgi:capsular polysaccharide biosynthesis protein/Mrp family chromosome partitioning ATPase